MTLKLTDTLQFHQNALNLRAYRQQLLAGNIANADTPNFKARDIDFRSALRGALAGRGDSLPLARTQAGHLSALAANPFDASVLYRSEQQSSVDGNTVDVDVERAEFAHNTLQYEASLTFIGGYLRTLQTAITGQ
jgi:flagellar basal-body rod protein FlgB